jgi:hypothetical protein
MTLMVQLRKILSICLLVIPLLFGTAFMNSNQTQALAKDSAGDSSVAAYRRLQKATYDYRGQFMDESKPDQRAGRAMTERMNDRREPGDRSEGSKMGGKNWAKTAKQSMRQAENAIRD